MSRAVKRYENAVARATPEDFKDAARMLQRLDTPMRDSALMDVAIGVCLASADAVRITKADVAKANGALAPADGAG